MMVQMGVTDLTVMAAAMAVVATTTMEMALSLSLRPECKQKTLLPATLLALPTQKQ